MGSETTEDKSTAPAFAPDQKLWWLVKGEAYGYRRRVPCALIEMSRSGKKAFIRFQYRNRDGRLETLRTYVDVKNVELREEIAPAAR